MSETQNWVRVAGVEEIEVGTAGVFEIDGRRIAIFHVEIGEFYATDDLCTHGNASLAEGWLEGCVIECPLHAGRFDVRTGQRLCEPIEEDLKTYQVRVAGPDLLLEVS
jgi:naphthalene 1,2-dioxygenase ferredoxin component